MAEVELTRPPPPIEEADALAALEETLTLGAITPAQLETFRSKFELLHQAVARSYEAEKEAMDRVQTMHDSIREDSIALQKAQLERDRLSRQVKSLLEQKEQALADQQRAEQADGELQLTLNELRQRASERSDDVDQLRAENAELVEPQLQLLRQELASLEADIQRIDRTSASLGKEKDTFRERIAKIQGQTRSGVEQLRALKAEWARVKGDPDRIAKQAATVKAAIDQVDVEVQRLQDATEALDKEASDSVEKHRELEAVLRAAEQRAAAHRREVDQRAQDQAELSRNVRGAEEAYQQLQERKLELQAEIAQSSATARSARNALSGKEQAYQRVLREVKRLVASCDSQRALLPSHRAQVTESEHNKAALERESQQVQKQLREVARELDVQMLRLRAQTGVEARQKLALEAALEREAGLMEERDGWRQEELLAHKQVSKVKQARESKARELSKLGNEVETAASDGQMKELILLDLTKQNAEVTSKLRRAGTLFESIKADRNGTVNAIQAAAQALAERKERVKILAHELHILRTESAAKDAALSREKADLARDCDRRDALRVDLNKERALAVEREDRVKGQLVTVHRLTAIINTAEREMLTLKGRYEAAVEARNYAGVQLIDRNDELCILYEKSAVQQDALQRGEKGMRELESTLRALELRHKELQQELRVARNRFPRLPELAERVLGLQRQLAEAVATSAKLSKELEDPSSNDRWKPLAGEDKDEEALEREVRALEARLGRQRERLLERDLVLEEVSGLAQQLASQAKEGRTGAAERAREATTLKTRVRKLTRRIMAAVSELSVWEATRLRLDGERRGVEDRAEVAEEREASGLAPTEHGTKLLARAVQQEALDRQKQAERQAEEAALAATGGLPPKRTTAVARPNSYIPDALGIPRPYGKNAPFRPQATGANMRHIRKPQPVDIEA